MTGTWERRIRQILVAVGLLAVLWPAGPVRAQEGTAEPEVQAEASEEEPAHVARKKKGMRLQGGAYLGRRKPVVGATVVVVADEGEGRAYVTTTDDQGRFRVEGLADGTYDLDILKEGLVAVEKDDVVVKFPFRPVVEVRMAPDEGAFVRAAYENAEESPTGGSFRFFGKVVDVGGEIVPEVTLRLVRLDGAEDPVSIRTGDDGTFSLEGLTSGGWDVEMRGVGYLPIRGPLTLERDVEVVAFLVAQPADYDASVFDLLPPEMPIPPPER